MLDPERYPFARLVVSTHRLPWGNRFFGDDPDNLGFERVDLFDSTTHMLISGGSIELADPPSPPAPSEE